MIKNSTFAEKTQIKNGPGLSLSKDLWTTNMQVQAHIITSNLLKPVVSFLKYSSRMEVKYKKILNLKTQKLKLKSQPNKLKKKLIVKFNK